MSLLCRFRCKILNYVRGPVDVGGSVRLDPDPQTVQRTSAEDYQRKQRSAGQIPGKTVSVLAPAVNHGPGERTDPHKNIGQKVKFRSDQGCIFFCLTPPPPPGGGEIWQNIMLGKKMIERG